MTAAQVPATQPCSVTAESINEPIPGSAPLATGWLLIEQNGPYGSQALIESHLPSAVGQRILDRTSALNVKPILIRRPGPHSDDHHGHARNVWWAVATPGNVAMRRWQINDPQRILELDLEALSRGDIDAVHPDAVIDDEPLLLVCTHARRDVCCARLGRPVVLELAQHPDFADRVWESSHIGGHRFAPTVVQLPHGWVFGRVDVADAIRILELARADEVDVTNARGRSSLPPSAQAADIAVRLQSASRAIDGTRVSETAPQAFRVTDATGSYEATVSVVYGPYRPESCGGEPIASSWPNVQIQPTLPPKD